jgi:hypothetical protein
MTPTTPILVIGRIDDPHVVAVLDAAQHGDAALVVDADTIRGETWELRPTGARIGHCAVGRGTRGWVRRVAPAGYEHGITLGSVEAAEHSAWLAFMTSLMRIDTIDWMTNFDTTLRAEDKLVQYAVAARLGVRHPETIVASSTEELAGIGTDVVIKPLGVGHYSDAEAGARVVPAQVLRTDDPRLAHLDGAPFIIQRRVRATAHLRTVTVHHNVFTARLPADDLPLDWRSDADAHHNFEPYPTPPDVRDGALRLADELDVGYSSQDWAVADDGAYFLDLNPVGQWLFLPEPVSAAVTRAIAAWLDNSSTG